MFIFPDGNVIVSIVYTEQRAWKLKEKLVYFSDFSVCVTTVMPWIFVTMM